MLEFYAYLGSAAVHDFNILSLKHNFHFMSLRHTDVWRHLDSITTHPTGSRLRRIDINFNYVYRDEKPDEDKINGLPLLHTKVILFVEVVLDLSGGLRGLDILHLGPWHGGDGQR
jgi:hypothetical protein